jgi:hypothetical protein
MRLFSCDVREIVGSARQSDHSTRRILRHPLARRRQTALRRGKSSRTAAWKINPHPSLENQPAPRRGKSSRTAAWKINPHRGVENQATP